MSNIVYMKPKKRQKLCHNCEGEIDLDVIVCPFCAADLREEKPEQRRPSYNPSFMHVNQQTNQSLYPPAYSIKSAPEEAPLEPEAREPVVAMPAEEVETVSKNIFAPVVIFTLGVQLFLFGFLMLLFSHKGVVVLTWNAHFWFWYVFSSIPFLYFGYKSIARL